MLRSGSSSRLRLKLLTFNFRATILAVAGISCVSPSAPVGESARGSSALSSRSSAWSRSGGMAAPSETRAICSRKASGYASEAARSESAEPGRRSRLRSSMRTTACALRRSPARAYSCAINVSGS